MIEFNWKNVLIFIAIGILLFLALGVVVAYAQSEDDNSSYAIITYSDKVPRAPIGNASNGTIFVQQMDTVYWNDVCDMTGVEGWYGKLIHKQTGKIIDVSSFTRRVLIAPDVFTVGEWDQWAKYEESNGNVVAFYVQEKRPDPKMPVNLSNETHVTLKPYIQPIPEKNVADYLVAKGDAINLTFENASVWIFGRADGFYDLKTMNGTYTLNTSQVQSMESGNYILVTGQPGPKSNSLNVRYVPETEMIEYFDPVQFKVMVLDLYGMDPKTRLDKFRIIQELTQDVFTEYSLTVQEPYIEIISSDQSYINSTTAVQTVRGYTNVAEGTPITVVVDKDRSFGNDLRFSTYTGVAKGSPAKPGDMRWFEISIPLLWENYGPGHHQISANTSIGGETFIDFDVYESPDHTFIPNNTIKYINGSEWRPDPTPIIITEVVTKEIVVTQTILVNVTPSQESVTQGQYESLVEFCLFIFNAVVVGSAVGIGTIYIISVGMRWNARRKEK